MVPVFTSGYCTSQQIHITNLATKPACRRMMSPHFDQVYIELVRNRMYEHFAEVREDDVIKLFRGVPFRTSLRKAANFTKDTGYESTFRVARDFYNGVCHVSGIIKGNTEDTDNESRAYADEFGDFDFDGEIISSDPCHRFVDLHFHPEATRYPVPSYEDLLGSQVYTDDRPLHKQIDIRPVIVVSHVLGNGDVIALLYQKKFANNIRQASGLEELKFALHETVISGPSNAVDCLERSGLFQADILALGKKYAYRPNKDDYYKLRRFVHTPRR